MDIESAKKSDLENSEIYDWVASTREGLISRAIEKLELEPKHTHMYTQYPNNGEGSILIEYFSHKNEPIFKIVMGMYFPKLSMELLPWNGDV